MRVRPTMPAVAVLGDVLVDLVLPVSRLPQSGEEAVGRQGSLMLGGSAVHTARALAAWGTEVRLVGCVGRDPLGNFACEAIRRAGLSPRWLQRSDAWLTGVWCVLVEPTGDRTMLAYRGANAGLKAWAIADDWLKDVAWLHVSGYAMLEAAPRQAALWAVDAARRDGLPVSFDPGMAVVHHGRSEMLSDVGWLDVLLPNAAEANALSGRANPKEALEALEYRAGHVFVKRGEEGCLLRADQEILELPPLPVEVTDTTGAGDAFDAGVILAALWGADERVQGALGNVMGALAAQAGPAALPLGPQEAVGMLSWLEGRGKLDPAFGEVQRLLKRWQGAAYDD